MDIRRWDIAHAEEFRRLIVKESEGRAVRLGQVATIEDELEDQNSMARLNGQAATTRVVMLDGGELVFLMQHTPQDGPDYSLGSKVQKLLNQPSLAFSVDGELLIVPMQQVRTIHISPIESRLPEGVVAHVTRQGIKTNGSTTGRYAIG